MNDAATAQLELSIERKGALQVITLNRPGVLNAISLDMRQRIGTALPPFARDPGTYAIALRSTSPKAFSVGGDVRELAGLWAADPARLRQALAHAYALCWHQDCFSKPTLSFIDGLVMGSGVGISLYGTHRIAGEGYAFAMPETALGFFPDVGTAHAFARMPHEIGTLIGLTGRRIGRADAYALGLATHCIDRAHFELIIAAVADADPVDPVLDERHVDPGPSALIAQAELIARCFGADTVEEILERLDQVARSGKESAATWAAEIRERSPTSLKVTLRFLRLARALDLKAVLELDQRLACRCYEGHDLMEGIRALVIEKDKRPRWSPARLEDVTDAMVEAHFKPLDHDELVLPTRAEMQARRT